MKQIELNPNSFHYKFATKFGWTPVYYLYYGSRPIKRDFCSYVRFLLMWSFLCLVAVIIGLTVIGVSMVSFYSLIRYGYNDGRSAMAMVEMGCFFVALTGWVLIKRTHWITRWFTWIPTEIPKLPYSEETKEFLSAAWEVLHDRLCFEIKVKGRAEDESDDGI